MEERLGIYIAGFICEYSVSFQDHDHTDVYSAVSLHMGMVKKQND